MKKKKLIILVLIVLFIAVGLFCSLKIYNKDRIDFTINDTLPDGDNKKAKVIILAGQSNASGCSSDTYLKKNVSAEKQMVYRCEGSDDCYALPVAGRIGAGIVSERVSGAGYSQRN